MQQAVRLPNPRAIVYVITMRILSNITWLSYPRLTQQEAAESGVHIVFSVRTLKKVLHRGRPRYISSASLYDASVVAKLLYCASAWPGESRQQIGPDYTLFFATTLPWTFQQSQNYWDADDNFFSEYLQTFLLERSNVLHYLYGRCKTSDRAAIGIVHGNRIWVLDFQTQQTSCALSLSINASEIVESLWFFSIQHQVNQRIHNQNGSPSWIHLRSH